jgi:hypothetical protein
MFEYAHLSHGIIEMADNGVDCVTMVLNGCYNGVAMVLQWF